MPDFQDREFAETLSNIIITKEDVLKKLKHLKPNKSPGPDGHHPHVLRECADALAYPLSIILQKILDAGSLPQTWKDANVTPIFKKGKRSLPSNYRPVSLTSIICKLMESLIRDHLVRHMSTNHMFTKYQHGFVEGRSCTTNLLAVLDRWTEAVDNGNSIDAIYLDFAKAFDTVPHQRLLKKLNGYGVRGKVFEWIKDFLSNRRQLVTVNGAKSAWSPVTSGVPQGSVLGPILFVVFINDLPEVTECLTQMFADDTKVFTTVKDMNDRQKLQNDLTNLYEWSSKWQLRFNASKCKVLHIGHNNPQFTYTMDSGNGMIELDKTTLEKDLGVNVDPELKFSSHVEKQVNKANRILGLIRRSYEYIDADVMKKLFTSLVRPHLEFGNVAWAPRLEKDKKLIEGVQRRATKLVPELSDLPYEERLKKLELPSLYYRRARGDIIEAYKYLHGKYTVNEDLLEKEERTNTRGHSLKLKKKYCKGARRANFFSYRIVNSWNALPDDVVTAPTMNCLKARLDKHWDSYRYVCQTIDVK